MADLKVDYQLLESIESSLGNLQSEFANIKSQTGAYDGAMGSPAIVSAMNGFSGNWNSHRKSLLTSIQSLGKMVSETIQQFQKTDKKLASSITEK